MNMKHATPDVRHFNFEGMRTELLRSRALFVDSSFRSDDSAIYPCPRDARHVIPGLSHVVWKRPHDMFPEPHFKINKARRHDLDQGSLGNCWFISAAAALATSHCRQFNRVVPPDQGFDDNYTGMFRFNFWWYGQWIEVVVDDYLPTDGHNKLIFCKNRERPNELWPCLLEKAYAKLHGCYFALEGGKMQDGMVDLTGGISEVIDITDKTKIDPGLYQLLFKSHQMKTMMGAAIFKRNHTTAREEIRRDGLVTSHAYSITGFKTINYNRGKSDHLLRLLNPWGNSCEWNGPWSDASPQIASLSPALRHDMMVRERDDGEFWMSYDDFVRCFDEIQLCHLQPDAYVTELSDNDTRQSWNVTVFHDAWLRGVTAGGCGNPPYQHEFWRNPQFFVGLHSVDSTPGQPDFCTLIVSLMTKVKDNKINIAIGFNVYKLKDPSLRTPLDDNRVPHNALRLTDHTDQLHYHREVTKRFDLPVGTYVIIPYTYEFGQQSEFLLRLYTEKRAESGILEDNVSDPQPVQPPAPQPITPAPATRDYATEVFAQFAGRDQRVDAAELAVFLEEVSRQELGSSLQFSMESCRSLLVLMDRNNSGLLNALEAKKAWKEIKVYREVFKRFDTDNSNSVDVYELQNIFFKLGLPVSQELMDTLARRYGGRDNRVSLCDFIIIICKLTTLFASFQKHQRHFKKDDDVAEFTRTEFLQTTLGL